MHEIRLPRLVGSRSSVELYIAALPEDLKGDRVVVHARELQSGTPSFADELVKKLLAEREAEELVLVGAGTDFIRYVNESANARDVADRVHIKPAGSEVTT